MTGRVVIITGANTGIGYRTAEILCDAGNDVVLACRDEERAKAALEKIFKKTPNALATFIQLDLSDLSSVRKFVDDFHATEKKLHVLINNAGVFLKNDTKRQFSKENFELTMGTNHLGHFLLTHLLLNDLKKTAEEGGDSRIINVTSSLHDPATGSQRAKRTVPLEMDNFFLENQGTYNGMLAYKNSKLAVILSTYELARQLQDSKIKVNTVCPGFIPSTELVRHASGRQKFFVKRIIGSVLRPVVKSVRTIDQGAKAVVDLCVNEELKEVTGKYFHDMKEAQSSEESYKEDLQKAVFETSARYCHLEGYEPLDAPPPPPEEPKTRTKSKKEKKAEETPGPSEEKEDKAEEKAKPDGKESDDKIDMKFADEDDKLEDGNVKKEVEKEISDKEEEEKSTETKEEAKDDGKEEVTKDDGKEEVTKDDGKEEVTKDDGKEEVTKDDGKEEFSKDDGNDDVTNDDGKDDVTKDDGKEEVTKDAGMEEEEVTKDAGMEEVSEEKQEEPKADGKTEDIQQQEKENITESVSTNEMVEKKTEDFEKKTEEVDKQIEEANEKIEESNVPPALPVSEVPEL